MKTVEIDIKQIKVDDGFWNKRIRHAVKNFKIAAGMEEGEFYGYQFQDSDVAK